MLPKILCMRTNHQNITVTVNNAEHWEINSSKENSFPNLSITFGEVFCLNSMQGLLNFHLKVENTIKPCDCKANLFNTA